MPEKHDADFYHKEDMAAANIGRDDAPPEDPQKIQEFLQQRQADWDFEDEQERIEWQVERFYQLLKQEGAISQEEAKEYYPLVYDYVANEWEAGENSSEEVKEFFRKMVEIDKRDQAGEWEKSTTIGQKIRKAKKE